MQHCNCDKDHKEKHLELWMKTVVFVLEGHGKLKAK
jgi:hypothetical protein